MSDYSTPPFEVHTQPLLSVAELAEWLGISPHTVRYWRHVGRGPRSLSVGGTVRYRAADVEDWLDRGAQPKAPEHA